MRPRFSHCRGQRRLPWSARHRENASRDQAHHPRLPGWASSPFFYCSPVGFTPCRCPPWRPIGSGIDQARALPATCRRRGLVSRVQSWWGEGGAERRGQFDHHVEQTVRQMGRGIRQRRRSRSHDRQAGPSHRCHFPQRRQLSPLRIVISAVRLPIRPPRPDRIDTSCEGSKFRFWPTFRDGSPRARVVQTGVQFGGR